MDIRYGASQNETKRMTTEELRKEFLIQNLFAPGQLNLVYSHIDRMILGGAVPSKEPVRLEADKKTLGVDYFLERRELAVINIGPVGRVTVDGTVYELDKKDCLYIGMGSKEVVFEAADPASPPRFFLMSAPAHTTYPTVKSAIEDAEPNHLGSISTSNERTIYKYVHPDGVKSCQLTLGMTLLKPGNMWNTMPSHTHERRSEFYLYFDMPEDGVVMHFMGEPNETRHLVVRNEQAIISPSWSIHSGVGTSSYTFIWVMAGENQSFTDMDFIPMTDLR